MVVGARQYFQFVTKIIQFPKNNRALFKFLREILHYIISIIKL